MTDNLAVQAHGLVKTYGGLCVLDGVTVDVGRGSVFALLGPNGAGKTTMVRILSTLVRADAGTASVAGFDVVRDRARVRRSISLTGQYAAVDELLTGAENLRMMAKLSGLTRPAAAQRSAELLQRFELADAGRRRVGTYSGGMRRRLDLAAGLVGRPSIVFLDEPTTGLDPRSRISMWQVIKSLAGEGATVFLTTQYLEEADQLADRIVVLDGGRVVADGSAVQLKQQYAQRRLDLTASGPDQYAALTRTLGGRIVHSDPSRLVLGVPTDGTAAQVRSLLDDADPSREAIAAFEIHTATLDDVFLALTGRAATTAQSTKETAGV
jgi:ABC-2 type transport system ATP-binding protein